MPEIAGKTDNSDNFEPDGSTETLTDANSSDLGVADRLRRALIGRKRSEIIAASGVSDGTISRALRGATTRRGTLASLADALGVHQEWLIHGTGPQHILETQIGPATPIAFARPEAPIINSDRLATALAAARQMFKTEGRQPTDQQLVKAMLVIYNHLTELQAQIDAEDAAAASNEMSEKSR